MKTILFAFFAIVLTACNTTDVDKADTITTLYFIRHAEKNRENPNDKDPALTEKGLARAKKWSDVFKNITFDAIYSTAYTRTVETASPTAYKNNLDIIKYEPENLNLLEIFKKGHENVLIVGHSNTVPVLVNKIIGEDRYEDIEDTNNANLYVVKLVNQKLVSVDLLYIP
ncbi:phosphoglycerate mutase family protein [Galbibacter mesophilus]|uniref:phosphoglycerate mutase family protein n=1 Tax=Galbibacter mesophilus TaxID=379069 RepID=UPI0019201C10|nr:phosphoglycerate mutase family protein [Galbibacter mesophilus]MCM5662872.1 histidine phosphatase family protein [Galbibacter mesophilus]